MEVDIRCFAAPKAEPTFSDMFMKEVEDESDVLKTKVNYYFKKFLKTVRFLK